MKRREFVRLAGFGVLSLAAGQALAKGRKPIAIASAQSGRKRVVVRLYETDVSGEYVAMARNKRKKTWFYRVRASRKDYKAIGAAVKQGSLSMSLGRKTVKLDLKLKGDAGAGSFQVAGGQSGEIQTMMDPITGTVIIVGIVGLAAIVAIVANTGGGKVKVDTPVGSADIEINGEEGRGDGDGEGEGGDGGGDNFIADEACDGPPILLC